MGERGLLDVFSIKKMIDFCGYKEVWRDFFKYFPLKCGSIHTLELIVGTGL